MRQAPRAAESPTALWKQQQEENHTTPARPKFPTFIHHTEGYVKATDMGQYMAYNYVYQYKDHLGNIRMNYAKAPRSGRIEIVDEHHYYPFGLKHTNYNVDEKDFIKEEEILELKVPPAKVGPYNYKYNGKEWQDELGLNFYDYGARNYDPAIGRWMNIDPLAEEYRRWSPYNYCMDNPVRFVDPDGMSVGDIYNANGVHIGSDGVVDGKMYLYQTTVTEQLSEEDSKALIAAGTSPENYNPGVFQQLDSQGFTNDGFRVFGQGGDAVAGSGNMEGDRGSGSIDADNPAGDLGMLTDFAAMILGGIDSAINWIGDFNERQASWGNKNSAAPTVNEISNDTTITISETHYYNYNNPISGEKTVEPRVTITKDTTVRKTDVKRVNSNQRVKNQNNYNKVK